MKHWVNTRNLPEKYVQLFEDFLPESTPALDAVSEWLTGKGWVLVLVGGPGTGKTIAAAHAVWQKSGSRFIPSWEFARVSLYDQDLSILERAPLLVIDDLGMEYVDQKGVFSSLLDGVMNARYSHGARTIITTNLPATKLREAYGGRLVDRIREDGTVIELGSQSMRGRVEMTRRREAEEIPEEYRPSGEPVTHMTPEQIEKMANDFIKKITDAKRYMQ